MPKVPDILKRGAAEFVALVFPPSCESCARPMPAGEGVLCAACIARVCDAMTRPYCRRCGQTVGPYGLRPGVRAEVRVCGQCDDQPLRFASLTRVGAYEDPLELLVRQLKFNQAEHLAGVLGAWAGQALSAAAWFDRIDALVPVPLHWRRRMMRGYNQAALLCDAIGESTDLAIEPVLRRPVHRPPQSHLPRSRRFENVRGVFTSPRPDAVAGRAFCLVDDVCTTGATLSEAARTLLGAGAREVHACVIAAAQPPAAYSAALDL